MFRDADGVSTGRTHHQNASTCGFFEVNIVDTYSSAPDNAQTRSFLQQLGSHFRRATDNECVGVGDLAVEIVFCREDDVPTGGAQEFYAPFANLICNDNFHRASCHFVESDAPYPLKRARSKRITVAASLRAVKSRAGGMLRFCGNIQREFCGDPIL